MPKTLKALALVSASVIAIILLLKALGWVLSPSLLEEPVSYPPEEIDAAERYREAIEASQTPSSVVVDVDYSEGPSADWYPKGESPILAELVAEGKLPPVAERVGSEPMVLQGLDGIGVYGGTLATAGTMPDRLRRAGQVEFGYPNLTRWGPLGYPIAPNVVREWETNENYTEWTFHLRKGMKWSDGHPFTADDILYWWEDEVNYFGGTPGFMISENQVADIVKIDDYSFKIVFPRPFSWFLERVMETNSFHSPKHYLQQYHPKLGNQDLIQREMRARNEPTPRSLYNAMKEETNPYLPSLAPWVLREEAKNAPYFLVRNPYYWAVDTEGNQLPYIDRIMIQVKSSEIITQAAVNGELDFQEAEIRIDDYTLLMAQRDQGKYDVYHWLDGASVAWTIQPNLNRLVDPDEPATAQKAALLKDVRFRKALSHSLDRQSIIDLAFHGWGEPAQGAPSPGSPYAHPVLQSSHLEYDPTLAGQLLDELGLTRRDAEGYRALPDGSRLVFYMVYPQELGGPAALLAAEAWREVGLRVLPRLISTALFPTYFRSLDYDMLVWQMPKMPEPLGNLRHYVPISPWTMWAAGYGIWYDSGGYYQDKDEAQYGIRPPQDHILWEAFEAFHEVKQTRDIEVWQRQLDRIYDIMADNLWNISVGTAPPVLAVVGRDLRNVPRHMMRIIKSPHNGGTELFYFENPSYAPGARERIKSVIAQIDAPEFEGSKESTLASQIQVLLLALLGLCLATGAILVMKNHPFIARRVAYMVPTLFIISTIVFFIIQMPPGNILDAKLLKAQLEGDPGAQAEIQQIKELFPIEEPFLSQYAEWMGFKWFFTFEKDDMGLLQGYLGRSMETLQPVTEMMGDRFLLTFAVSAGTILFTWLTALPIGVYSAVRQYSPGDYAASIIGFIGMSVPNFLLAILLMYMAKSLFGVNVSGLFSPEYAAQPHWDFAKFVDLLKHIWVPIVVLGTGGTAGMIRVMRANLLDELRKPYVTTARAKGVRPGKLLVKYPVRMALNPFISSIGNIFPSLISGGAIVGIVLSLPTIGPLQLSAIMSEDHYLAGSLLMLLSLLGVLGTLVSDLLLLWLDPRIRMGGGSK